LQHFSEFPKRDWLTLLPLRYAFKEVQNDAILAAYLKRLPETLPSFLRDNAQCEGKNVALIIAFGQPRILDFLLGKAAQFVSGTNFLVFDNSPAAARSDIIWEYPVPHRKVIKWILLRSWKSKMASSKNIAFIRDGSASAS
jgi:hypothetical protein